MTSGHAPSLPLSFATLYASVMAALLLVEDDERIGELVQSALHGGGHSVAWQRTGTSALVELQRGRFDLVLLDLGLPDADGIDLCRRFRATQPDTILVILTARREEMDIIVGLEAGADDYLTKPFGLTELLARVRAHLRRGGTGKPQPPRVYEVADLCLDTGARRCLVAGHETPLRPKEFDLLARLARSAGSAVSREDLMADVWDENWFGATKTLDVHMAVLRRRLAEAAGLFDPPARAPRIITLRGYGYRMDSQ